MLRRLGLYPRSLLLHRRLDALGADVRFAVRHFARTPGTTLTMVVVLVVGIGISALLFANVHAYARQPPPGVSRSEDLVRIRGSRNYGGGERIFRTFPEAEFLAYRRLTDHFAAMTGWTDATVPLAVATGTERRTEQARVSFVTDDYFRVLGVHPALGPGLPALPSEDPARSALAIIGHITWEQLFGASPGVIGSTVFVNGVAITIVGVAPERFTGFPGHSRFQLWIPLPARRLLLPDLPGEFRAVARLRPGVDIRAASAAAAAVAARAAESIPEASLRAQEPSADVVPLLSANGDPMFDRDVRLMSVSVGLLGLLILLVTCTNVSALLTGLASARRQEIAVRLSLGAARTRLVRQLLTESVLLAVLAGAAALGLVWAALRAATGLIPALPYELDVTWPAAAFTFGVASAVGIGFGLSPALHATRLGLAIALRDSTATIAATRARLQRGLVIAQIALTQPLIVLLTALLLDVLMHLAPPERSGIAEHLIEVRLRASAPITGSTSAADASSRQVREATRRLHTRLEATPGVAAAAIDWGVRQAFGAYVVHRDDRVDEAGSDPVQILGEVLADDFFDVMSIRLVRGREFGPGDVRSYEARSADIPVLMGADLARRLWAGADPTGRRLVGATDTAGAGPTLVVIGVFEDPAAETRKAGEEYRVYTPADTMSAPRAVLLRSSVPGNVILPLLHGLVREEAPDMAARIQTVAQIEDDRRRRLRLATGGLTAAGAAALLLSAIGLYAVVAFAVGQRTKEIAVRLAVGARGPQIVRRFIVDGLRLTVFGLLFGLPISLIGLDMLIAVVSSPDLPPVSLTAVMTVAAVGVILVATAAAWIPARRAASVNPAVTLRGD